MQTTYTHARIKKNLTMVRKRSSWYGMVCGDDAERMTTYDACTLKHMFHPFQLTIFLFLFTIECPVSICTVGCICASPRLAGSSVFFPVSVSRMGERSRPCSGAARGRARVVVRRRAKKAVGCMLVVGGVVLGEGFGKVEVWWFDCWRVVKLWRCNGLMLESREALKMRC